MRCLRHADGSNMYALKIARALGVVHAGFMRHGDLRFFFAFAECTGLTGTAAITAPSA